MIIITVTTRPVGVNLGGTTAVGNSTETNVKRLPKIVTMITGVLIVVHGGMVISIVGNDFGRMKGDPITMIGEILTGKIIVIKNYMHKVAKIWSLVHIYDKCCVAMNFFEH